MTWPLYFTGPRIGASGENVSPPSTGHQKGQKWSGVAVGIQFFHRFFSERGDCMYSKACCVYKVSRKHSKIWPAYVELNGTQRKNSILHQNQVITSNYINCTCFPHKSSNVHAVFKRYLVDPEILYTCSTCPSRDPTSEGYLVFCSAEYVWSYVVRTYTCINVSKKSAAS